MGRYAEGTSVSPDRSKGEIEKTLQRYGCTSFAYGWEEDRAMIAFKAHGMQVRFLLPMPKRDDYAFTDTGRERTMLQTDKAYDQAIRQRWRALSLAIKAKLEAVESGIVGFEDEFLAHFVLPSGQTVGETITPELNQVVQRGLPPLLPSGN